MTIVPLALKYHFSKAESCLNYSPGGVWGRGISSSLHTLLLKPQRLNLGKNKTKQKSIYYTHGVAPIGQKITITTKFRDSG